jgi:hypothetical protein
MTFGTLPFGITDMYAYPLDGSDAPGTGVLVPAGRTLTVAPKEDTNQLTGYNGVVATNVSKTSADVTLEHGGISLDLLAMISGGTIVTTGTTPNQKKTLDVGSAAVTRPYVMLEGRALADDGGDTIAKVWKVKFQIPEGSFKEGEYYIASLKGEAVRNANGKLLSFIARETAAALTTTAA